PAPSVPPLPAFPKTPSAGSHVASSHRPTQTPARQCSLPLPAAESRVCCTSGSSLPNDPRTTAAAAHTITAAPPAELAAPTPAAPAAPFPAALPTPPRLAPQTACVSPAPPQAQIE